MFIACEGQNTEPLYFERIKEAIEDEEKYALTIYPERSQDKHKSDPFGLVEEAQARINDFDEVWVVYDKNGHAKHSEAVAKAQEVINGKQVNIAFSSIAFEHWVLLHFERSDQAFAKSKEIIDYLADKKYFIDYSKSSTSDTYPVLMPYLNTALKNTAWLHHQMQPQLEANENKYYEINPYTNIDVLVRKLLEIKEVYLFSTLEKEVTIDSLIFYCQQGQNKIQVAVFNEGKNAILSKNITVQTSPKTTPISFSEPTIIPNQPAITTEFDYQGAEEIIIKYSNTTLTILL